DLQQLANLNPNTRDITLTLTNTGNATSSYNGFVHIPGLNALLQSGYRFQVIVERVYKTPFLDDKCQIKELPVDEVITNITSNSPALASSGIVSPTSPVFSSPVFSSPVFSSPVFSSPVPLDSIPLASSATFAIAPSPKAQQSSLNFGNGAQFA